MKIKERASIKCRRKFPHGIRIGTKVTIECIDGSGSQKLSKAISPYCPPLSLHRDGLGSDKDFYHYENQNACTGEKTTNYVDVPNNSVGTVSYIYASSTGEPLFHVYVEGLDATIFCDLADLGVFDEYEDEGEGDDSSEETNDTDMPTVILDKLLNFTKKTN